MNKIALSILVFMGCFSPIYAQKSIKGVITDSTQIPMPGATIILSAKSDSALVAFTRSDPNGIFELKSIRQGEYKLRISFVGYKTYNQVIKHTNETLDLGKIVLKSHVYNSAEATIEAERPPMVVKGDTLEFNASSFRVAAGSNLEQLLKKLPGITVEKDGTIHAMGKQVQKLVVNGKEFFGADPSIATQNLPADIIKSVQVYDDKTDDAKFAKVDDGVEMRTLNIVLKKDKLKGYFGSLVGGYGTEERYAANFLINRFTGKTQFSLLSGKNNISDQKIAMGEKTAGLDVLSDAMSSGYASLAMSDISFKSKGSSASYGFSNMGLNTTSLTDFNLSHSPNNKTSFQLNMMQNNLESLTKNDIESRQTLNVNNIILNTTVSEGNKINQTQYMGMTLKHSFSDQKQLEVYGNIARLNSDTETNTQRANRNADKILVNQSSSEWKSNESDQKEYAGIVYRRAFSKKGRSLLSTFNLNHNQDEIDTENKAEDLFFGGNTARVNLNQNRNINREGQAWTTNFTLNEPVGNKKTLQFIMRTNKSTNQQNLDVFDVQNGIEIPNTIFSNQYLRETLTNDGTIAYSSSPEKKNIRFGVLGKSLQMQSQNITSKDDLDRQYFYVLPFASYQYKFSDQKNVDFRYNSSMREPLFEQLQPIYNNQNTMLIIEGNPDLRPSTTHSLNIGYRSFALEPSRQFSFQGGTSYEVNPIRQATFIDEQFRQIQKPVNSRNSINANTSLYFGKKNKALGSYLNFQSNADYRQFESIINNQSERGNLWSNSFNLSISTDLDDLIKKGKSIEGFSSYISMNSRYNVAQYPTNSLHNVKYWTHSVYANADATFKHGIGLQSELNYSLYPASSLGKRQSIPILEASMFKLLLKEKLKVELMVFDILNKNQTVFRTITPSLYRETRVNAVNRYILLRCNYSLAGFGK